MTSTAAADIDVLAPAGTSVVYLGESVFIAPVRVGRIPALVKLIRPMLAAAKEISAAKKASGDAPADGVKGGDSAAANVDSVMGIDITFELLFELIEDHGDGLFKAVALLTGRDVDWVQEGDTAEFVELALAVVEVNRDFFTKRIIPLLGDQSKVLRGDG